METQPAGIFAASSDNKAICASYRPPTWRVLTNCYQISLVSSSNPSRNMKLSSLRPIEIVIKKI